MWNDLGEQLKRRYIQHAKATEHNGFQVDTRLVQLKENISDALKELDYSHRLETAEEFIDKVEPVSSKQAISTIAAAAPGTCIALTGPRGIGKSTFIRRMCHCWALGCVLQQCELLFCIDLSTAGDQYFSDISQLLTVVLTTIQGVTKTQIQALVRKIVQTNGKGVLIVLDHFNSRHSKLLTKALQLKQVVVVVSSAHAIKCECCNIRFHVLGLTERQLVQQVLHYYQDDHSKTEYFLQYISGVPNFSKLKRVPVYLYGLLSLCDVASTAHYPQTLMVFLSCLTLFMLNLSQDELNQMIELLESESLFDIFDMLPHSKMSLLQNVCMVLSMRSKSLFQKKELVFKPNPPMLLKAVHVALPLQSGEWIQLTQYPLLNDFLASVGLYYDDLPIEHTVQHLISHKELQYFCLKIIPHIQDELEKQTSNYFLYKTSYSYEDNDTADSALETVEIYNTAVTAWRMYLLTIAKKAVFTRCDFSPASAIILSKSLGSGSSVYTLDSECKAIEYVRYVNFSQVTPKCCYFICRLIVLVLGL